MLKQIRATELIESIRKVASGVQLLDQAEIRMRLRKLSETDDGSIRSLTPQESRIFELIGEGMSNLSLIHI